MKALVLAAGRGKRLRPLTDNVPKCLLNIGERTVLERSLEILKKNFDDIILIVGYKKEMILEKFKFKHVVNKDYETTNSIHSLWLAKDLIDDDTLIMNSDVLFDDHLIQSFISSSDGICIGLTTNWNPGRGYKVKVIKDKVVEMGMDVNPVYGEYAGFIFIKKSKLDSFKNKLDELHSKNKNLWFEDVFSQMAREEEPIGFFDVKNFNWYEFDTLEEYKIANKVWGKK